MVEGQALRLLWTRSASEDAPPTETALVQATATEKAHQFIGGRLGFDFNWEAPSPSDDW